MAKIKSMGTEYQIKVESNWQDLKGLVRTTKQLIKDTQSPSGSFFFEDEIRFEDRYLRRYVLPKEDESFSDYQRRFMQALAGTGLRGKIAKLAVGKKAPLNFHLTQNNGESILAVDSILREGEYKIKIGASGDYEERGKEIAEGIKQHVESEFIKHNYITIEDKMIEY